MHNARSPFVAIFGRFAHGTGSLVDVAHTKRPESFRVPPLDAALRMPHV